MGLGENIGERVGECVGSSGSLTSAGQWPSIYAATRIFVDSTLGGNITNGTYSVANRDNTGSEGNAYTTLQGALNNMDTGDHIILRGGTYTSAAHTPVGEIDISLNGTAWTTGNYNKICSMGIAESVDSSGYPQIETAEWAILDGELSTDVGSGGCFVLGYPGAGTDASSADAEYWIFERLEVKRAGGSQMACGIYVNGGPNWFRFVYSHGNVESVEYSAYSGGLGGMHWHDNIVEFCYVTDNHYVSAYDNNNTKAITWTPAYNLTTDIDNSGDFSSSGEVHDENNEIRYNLVDNDVVGIGPKHYSSLTSRIPGTGHGYFDTYNDRGHKIHHNIVLGTANTEGQGYSIGAHGDFDQVHHNIIHCAGDGIRMGYIDVDYPNRYKPCVYNNTIIFVDGGVYEGSSQVMAIVGLFQRISAAYEANDYKYIYNNIAVGFDSGTWYTCPDQATFLPQNGETSGATINFSNHEVSHNYAYSPAAIQQYSMGGTLYTSSQWAAQTITQSPRTAYVNTYDAGDPLFVDTSGSDQYITNGDHILTGAITVADGGRNTSHPYLAGVSIPVYIGATDPSVASEDSWATGVYALNVMDSGIPVNLRDAVGDPAWIE